MSAHEVMVTDIVTARPFDTVAEAIQKMLDNDLAGLPVVDDDMRVVGQVTEVQVLSLVLPAYVEHLESIRFLPDDFKPFERLVKSAGATLVADLMSQDFESCEEDASLPSLTKRMVKAGVRRIFVLRDGKLVGTVGRRDLLRVMLEKASEEAGVPPEELL